MTDEIKERQKRPCPFDQVLKAETIAALDPCGVIRDLANICAEYDECPPTQTYEWDWNYGGGHTARNKFSSACACSPERRVRRFDLADTANFGDARPLHYSAFAWDSVQPGVVEFFEPGRKASERAVALTNDLQHGNQVFAVALVGEMRFWSDEYDHPPIKAPFAIYGSDGDREQICRIIREDSPCE